MNEIEDLLSTYKVAVFEKDVEAYASIFDEHVRVFDMWGKWSCDRLEDWRQMAKDWFAALGTDKDRVDFESVNIEVGELLAMVTAFVRFTAVSDEGQELRYLQNRLTWVIRKHNNVWKIIHQHTSCPIDLSTMKVMLHR